MSRGSFLENESYLLRGTPTRVDGEGDREERFRRTSESGIVPGILTPKLSKLFPSTSVTLVREVTSVRFNPWLVLFPIFARVDTKETEGGVAVLSRRGPLPPWLTHSRSTPDFCGRTSKRERQWNSWTSSPYFTLNFRFLNFLFLGPVVASGTLDFVRRRQTRSYQFTWHLGVSELKITGYSQIWNPFDEEARNQRHRWFTPTTVDTLFHQHSYSLHGSVRCTLRVIYRQRRRGTHSWVKSSYGKGDV